MRVDLTGVPDTFGIYRICTKSNAGNSPFDWYRFGGKLREDAQLAVDNLVLFDSLQK